MRAALLAALFSSLAQAAQGPPGAAEPPAFRLEVPPGYGPFGRGEGPGEAWRSSSESGAAQFLVETVALEAPGAVPEAVAADARRRRWDPLLRGSQPRFRSWAGSWAGRHAAGTEIEFRSGGAERAIVERFLVLDDRLVVGTWEGPAQEVSAARAALDTFQLPAAWIPPSFATDPGRGLGPGATVLPPPGTLVVAVTLNPQAAGFQVGLLFEPNPALPWPDGPPVFLFPASAKGIHGPEAEEGGGWRLRYEVNWTREEEATAAGVYPAPQALAALDPGWLAIPLPPGGEETPEASRTPPAWRLEVAVPAHLAALSWSPPAEETISEELGLRRVVFRAMGPGQAWPFFLVGLFEPVEVSGLTLWQRRSARSLDPEGPLRFLDLLGRALQDWLPGAAAPWAVATFPLPGDRHLPGLVALAEGQEWLRSPLDAPWWRGGTRRAGLAERMAARAFGLRLRGAGTGAPFLEASLAQYGAWRLLQACGRTEEAEALHRAWRQSEETAGPLPRPLSLLPRADVQGAQRLLTRGPLVWRAIEEQAGRAVLDALLRNRVQAGGIWTTEDLRADLERVTGRDWSPFFERHLYGREPVPAE